MPRTPYTDPKAEKAYQDTVNNSSKPSGAGSSVIVGSDYDMPRMGPLKDYLTDDDKKRMKR